MTLAKYFKKFMRVYGRQPRLLPVVEVLKQPIRGVMNPAFLPCDDPADYAIVCRQQYYAVDRRGIMIGDPSVEKTHNILFRQVLSRDGGAPEDGKRMSALQGLEDARFYVHDGRLHLVASRLDLSAEKRTEIVLGYFPSLATFYEGGDFVPCDVEGLLSRIEKNWVYFENENRLMVERLPGMRDIYAFDPGLRRFSAAGVPQQHEVWSGTKSISWNGGNLFLDHKRVHVLTGTSTIVRFAYRFRFHASLRTPPQVSSEFSLAPAEEGLVYASDMQVMGDQLHIAVGIDDARSQIFQLPSDEVARQLAL
ncbi:MAG: hypothetical protein ACK5JT_03405 [Hyphomicrobiaceae bacterium]